MRATLTPWLRRSPRMARFLPRTKSPVEVNAGGLLEGGVYKWTVGNIPLLAAAERPEKLRGTPSSIWISLVLR
jgi:hypothetical protein